jgi:hypothetical protein
MYPTGDINQDGIVNAIDLSLLVSRWNTNDPDADLNNDGTVNAIDLSLLVSNWGATGTPTGTALLVTNESTLSAGNQALSTILSTAGYVVTTRTWTEAENYTGIDVVVVSTGNPPNDSGKYVNPPVGMVAVDSWRPLGMGTNLGFLNSINEVQVTNPSHPIAAGTSGIHAAYSEPRYITWELDLSASPTVIATRPSQAGQAVIFAYEAGSMMTSRYATTRHVGLGYHEQGLAVDLSAQARSQLLAAVAWARASTYVAPPPPAAPTGLTATAGDTQVSLTWNTVAGAASYTIKRSTTSGGPYTTIQSNVTTTSFTNTGLTNGTTYYYVVSAVNTQGESANSSQVSGVPVVGSGGGGEGGFLYSAADLTVFRQRMTGAGPYYNFGDAGHGGAWSPNDGAQALSRANAFLGNPTAARWIQPVPMTPEDPWPGERLADREPQTQVLAAAWCALTLPNHANNAAWRTAVKDLLLWTADQPNHDFSDNSKYSLNYPGYAPSPSFAVAYWLVRLIKAYDFLGRGSFTSAELARLDRMFYGAGNYCLRWFHHTAVGSKVPNRLSYNFATTHVDMQGSWYQNNMNFLPYDGGPYVSAAGAWNNRTAHMVELGALVANYFKFYNVTPPSGGTQPSYGWLTVDQMLLHSRVYVAEWLHFSVSPLGYCFDYHRGQQSGATDTHWGWRYASNETLAAVNIARWFARRGDDSVWSMSTIGGHNNTSGSPNNTSGVSGFPAKTVEFMVWSHARYLNDAWNRRLTWGGVTSGTIPSPNPYRDVIAAAMVSNRYPGNGIINSAWRRSGNNFPAYTQAVEHQGVWSPRQGMGATFIGLIEVAGL